MSAPGRTTARLCVIVPPELATGFRLAGSDVAEASDTDDAVTVLGSILDDGAAGAAGIIGVYSPYYDALPIDLAERCDRLTDPIVIPLPTGLGADDAASHRARIAALLERAVGYHIAFGDEAAS